MSEKHEKIVRHLGVELWGGLRGELVGEENYE